MGTESKNTEDASSERKELRKKKMRDEGRYCRCVGAAYPQPRTLDRMGGGKKNGNLPNTQLFLPLKNSVQASEKKGPQLRFNWQTALPHLRRTCTGTSCKRGRLTTCGVD